MGRLDPALMRLPISKPIAKAAIVKPTAANSRDLLLCKAPIVSKLARASNNSGVPN